MQLYEVFKSVGTSQVGVAKDLTLKQAKAEVALLSQANPGTSYAYMGQAPKKKASKALKRRSSYTLHSKATL